MKKLKLFLGVLVSFSVLSLATLPAFAQGSDVVIADVDRTHLTTDETLVLTISIDTAGGNATQPSLPSMSDFIVVGSSSGTQMSLINGNLSIKANYQYRLKPTKAGNLVIDPVTVKVDGQTYNTEPIAITVDQGSGVPQSSSPSTSPLFPSFPNFPLMPSFPSLPSSPAAPSNPADPIDPGAVPDQLAGQRFYVEAEVDNETPYQGEQVRYAFRFYQSVDFLGQQPTYQAPTFTGFWSEMQPNQAEYSIQAAGRAYRVTELQTVLFPTVVGEVSIEPATLTIPRDMFSRGQVLQSQPVTLNVMPLPDTAPADFTGAVGHYDITAEADTTETKVNETVTLKVTLTGVGNLENLADPVWSEGPEWRAFDSQSSVQTVFEDGKLGGTRTYERLLVPTTAGNLTLPAIQYSYFDPELADYATIATDPISIGVESGDDDLAAPLVPAGAMTSSGAAPTSSGSTLRPNKPASELWFIGSPFLTQKTGYWLLWGVPLLLLATHFGWQQQKKHHRNNVSARRSRQAAKRARQALRQARKSSKSPVESNGAAGRILLDYLSEKLDRSISGLTHSGLGNCLQEGGIEPSLVERVQTCLVMSEMGSFAPAGQGDAVLDILTETENVIDELEKEF